MIVGRYGIHVAEGIPFLLQRSAAINLISPALKCPFEPHIRPKNERCPHNFDLGQTAPRPDWMDHPLAAGCSPTPGYSAVWVYDPDDKMKPTIQALRRMSNPTFDHTLSIWMQDARAFNAAYAVTNVGPMIFTSVEVNHTRSVHNHLNFARSHNRKLVVVARERLPLFNEIQRVEPLILDLDQPFERIGAGLLRQHMEDIQNGKET